MTKGQVADYIPALAFRVGIPGKSGVAGGIVAIIPEKLSICVWSPGLNKFGNFLAGILAL